MGVESFYFWTRQHDFLMRTDSEKADFVTIQDINILHTCVWDYMRPLVNNLTSSVAKRERRLRFACILSSGFF